MTQTRLACWTVLYSGSCLLGALGCAPDKARCASEAPAGAEAVVLMADDDVCLAADLYAGPDPDRAVVLVHDAGGDRGAWPADFIAALQGAASVLVIDRRGAGDSELGPARGGETDGRVLDVGAAVGELNRLGFGFTGLLSAGEANAGAVSYAGSAASTGKIGVDHVVLGAAGPEDESIGSYPGLAASPGTARLLVPTPSGPDEAALNDWLATIEPLSDADFVVEVGGSPPGEAMLIAKVGVLVDDLRAMGGGGDSGDTGDTGR